MMSQTCDTSLSVDPQETGWGILRNHVGNSKLGCYRDPGPSRFKPKKQDRIFSFQSKRFNEIYTNGNHDIEMSKNEGKKSGEGTSP